MHAFMNSWLTALSHFSSKPASSSSDDILAVQVRPAQKNSNKLTTAFPKERFAIGDTVCCAGRGVLQCGSGTARSTLLAWCPVYFNCCTLSKPTQSHTLDAFQWLIASACRPWRHQQQFEHASLFACSIMSPARADELKDEEAAVYDRQLRVWGVEVQRK